MDISRDIQSLSRFKRNTPEFVRQLKETGEPIVLTVNGKAELVVQDASSYQRLRDLVDRLEAIEAVQQGLAEMRAGKGRPASEFFAEMEREFDISTEA